jgi:hypothetical protein
MPFTEKEIEQIIKEIKERVEKQVGLISEGAMEYLAEGLREKLAEMQTEITEMEKERLITDLEEKMIKVVQLLDFDILERLREESATIAANFPNDKKLLYPEPIRGFRCPTCKKYSLTVNIMSAGLTTNRMAFTAFINIYCEGRDRDDWKNYEKCNWKATSIGLLYILDNHNETNMKINFCGGFNLQDELNKKELDYKILY